jgi:hypothetical protein
MDRISALIVAVALLLGAATGVHANAPYKNADLDARLTGYPEFVIRLGEDRIEAPARAIAGRTLVVEENPGAEEGHAFMLRIPDDVTEATVQAVVSSADSAAQETPEWFWRATFAGNPDRAAPGGGRAVALVDLVPGRYLVGDPFRPASEYARVEVVAETVAPATKAEGPDAAVVAAMHEMAFDLPKEVHSGRQIWRVDNTGGMPHEIALLPVPAGATADDVKTAIGALMADGAPDATPAAGDPLAKLGAAWACWHGEAIAGVGATSPSRSVWAQIDLAPGTYAAVCFVPDPATFTPHLMMGMTSIFTVDGETA